MKFGLSTKSIEMIIEALSRWREIEKAAIFCSRSMGNYKQGSDVDLVVYGDEITEEIVQRLSTLLNEELPLPYYFDVLHYETITDIDLKKHIDEYGRLVSTISKPLVPGSADEKVALYNFI
ncbi:MAG: nucleotidyltransferase domain-containing protein [Bacillota bacterium]|nr:nucleotidyltransferase domain-containing protein [Bacillota bacterium]